MKKVKKDEKKNGNKQGNDKYSMQNKVAQPGEIGKKCIRKNEKNKKKNERRRQNIMKNVKS